MDAICFKLPFEDEFRDWLQRSSIYIDRTIQSRISNLRAINRYYGPLIEHWNKDNFLTLLMQFTYTKLDKASFLPNPSLIPIEGDIYNALATYKSALNLYKTFISSNHVDVAYYPFGEIGLKVHRALEKLSASIIKRVEYTKTEVKSEIIEPLLLYLDEELGLSMQYTFCTELTPVDGYGKRKTCDRYDIIGEAKDLPVIIVEVDTHRSDQISKKVVSRIAMNADKEVLYVSLLYPNTHVNSVQEIKECKKYIDFLDVLFSLFSEPQKSYMYHWL